MEASFDWRAYQSAFHVPHPMGGRQVQAVVEDGVIVAAFGDGEDLQSWIGAPLSEMKEKLGARGVFSIERQVMKSMLESITSQPLDLRAQLERFKSECVSHGETLPFAEDHFLIAAIRGWWGRVFPSSFGFFLRQEENGPIGRSDGQSQDVFLLFRRGGIELYQEPDFTSVGPERSRDPDIAVRYLAEKHGVPVQGVVVLRKDWENWSHSSTPWREMTNSIRTGRARIMPFRWGIAALVGARGIFGV